jgi:hypothetical protein
MDGQGLDRIARAIAACTSRRQAVQILAAAVLSGSLPGRTAAAQGNTASCDAGLTYCAEAGGCVDLLSDLNHCGACGNLCASELVAVECRGGECARADCPAGLAYCGAEAMCRDLYTDPVHCGACGNACASGACASGTCAPVDGVCVTDCAGCAPGQTLCDGVCVDTCCNNRHCGACGNVCPSGTSCFEGVCDCPSGLCCAEGEILCGETCVATCCDNNNCGACGNVCPEGFACFEGVCDCPSGYCPPIELPHTGHGPGNAQPGQGQWIEVALVSAASALAGLWHAGFIRIMPRTKIASRETGTGSTSAQRP